MKSRSFTQFTSNRKLRREQIFDAVANEQNLDLTAVSEILDNMVESIGRSPDALLWLAKLKQTDDYSYNHALQRLDYH